MCPEDPWWNEVCDQLRTCSLSKANHAYLHGEPVDNCPLSAEERASRRRVITGPNDERLTEDRFLCAPAIVANNDAKYQINKDRAKYFARTTGVPLHWSFAVDKASSAVLQNQAIDKETKLLRLDRTCSRPPLPRSTVALSNESRFSCVNLGGSNTTTKTQGACLEHYRWPWGCQWR